MAVQKSILKITLSSQKDVFLACTYEVDKKLYISLLDIAESEGFYGSVTDSDLRLQAARIPMVFKDFLCLSRKALIQNDSDDQFLYSLDKTCEDFVFKWKSIDRDETIINIGCVKICKKNYTSLVNDVFMMLSEELVHLNKKVVNIEACLQRSQKEKLEAVTLLSAATNAKESLEKELYAKFVLVLNEKKKRIQDLEQDKCNRLPKKMKITKEKSSKKPVSFHHQISDSSDEIDSHLESINEPGPSMKKRNSSLLFDDEDPVLPVTPSKIRNRTTTSIKVRNFHNILSSNITESKLGESEDELLNIL